MQISFQSDIKRLTKDLKAINKKAIPKATVQAINRTATGTKTDAKREVSKVTGLAQKEIEPNLRVWKASKNKQVASVNARKGEAKNLIHYVSEGKQEPNVFNYRRSLKSGKKGKYKSKGVRARAWGKTKTYEGTFIGKGRTSGKYLVFARTSSKRTPLKSILGPSIRNTFDSKPMQAKLKSMASARFQKNMRDAVRLQLIKAKGGLHK